MPQDIIPCASLAAANALQAKIHSWCQANISGYNAQRWDTPAKHPTLNKWKVVYKPKADSAFSAGERSSKEVGGDDWRANPTTP